MRNAWFLLAALMAVTTMTNTAWAQDEADEDPTVLRLSWFMCDLSDGAGDRIEEEIETQVIPVWDAMIAEGGHGIQSYGYIYHWWADEWNVGIYTLAETIDAVIKAEQEAGDRLEAQYGDGPSEFGQACGPHRDGFYTMGPSTNDDEE